MKINEVEALAGITKKNIRFYEEQGLLSPRRNAENGYREYCDGDVQILRRIRLLRKLDVPIEEIRQMFAGTHTPGGRDAPPSDHPGAGAAEFAARHRTVSGAFRAGYPH